MSNLRTAIVDNKVTTAFGIGLVLVGIGSALTSNFDGDPLTTPNWEIIMNQVMSGLVAIAAGMGLISAADGKAPPKL